MFSKPATYNGTKVITCLVEAFPNAPEVEIRKHKGELLWSVYRVFRDNTTRNANFVSSAPCENVKNVYKLPTTPKRRRRVTPVNSGA